MITCNPAPRRRDILGRQLSGISANANGVSAEDRVAEQYLARGARIVARRWRGQAGEIDLILREAGCHVFVEVKRATTRDLAAERLSRRQMDRICLAACEFCATLDGGDWAEMRFDAALVDAQGRVEIIEAAFGAH